MRVDCINECRKQILYLEAYSRQENLKLEGIPESFETSAQQSTPAEDKRKVLVNFIEDALGTEDGKGIEFQSVHRMENLGVVVEMVAVQL